jgi:tetratricopeptide (TPR) repeat protein
MEIPHFIFWEGLKTVSLVFLALLAVKIISTMRMDTRAGRYRPALFKGALYVAVLAIAALGAWVVGNDVAAEFYYLAAGWNASQNQIRLEYSNALRAIRLRPDQLRYWQALEQAKVTGQQYASALNDEPAILWLNGGTLSESDEIRFALCHYFLGQYEQALSASRQVIQKNPYFPFAYIVQGSAYTALRQYGAAENAFLMLLRMDPTDVDGVDGLAQAYFLAGNRPRAMAVLNATRQYSFSPQARKRFEELKELYAQ